MKSQKRLNIPVSSPYLSHVIYYSIVPSTTGLGMFEYYIDLKNTELLWLECIFVGKLQVYTVLCTHYLVELYPSSVDI